MKRLDRAGIAGGPATGGKLLLAQQQTNPVGKIRKPAYGSQFCGEGWGELGWGRVPEPLDHMEHVFVSITYGDYFGGSMAFGEIAPLPLPDL